MHSPHPTGATPSKTGSLTTTPPEGSYPEEGSHPAWEEHIQTSVLQTGDRSKVLWPKLNATDIYADKKSIIWTHMDFP